MTITVDRRWCKGCGLCVAICNRAVLAMGDTRSHKGFRMPDVVNPDACIGCMLCERICPDLCLSAEKEGE